MGRSVKKAELTLYIRRPFKPIIYIPHSPPSLTTETLPLLVLSKQASSLLLVYLRFSSNIHGALWIDASSKPTICKVGHETTTKLAILAYADIFEFNKISCLETSQIISLKRFLGVMLVFTTIKQRVENVTTKINQEPWLKGEVHTVIMGCCIQIWGQSSSHATRKNSM